jgi:hypothetical protein
MPNIRPPVLRFLIRPETSNQMGDRIGLAKATTHTRAALQPIGWNDFVAVMTAQSFEPRMVCTKCGTIGADVRPNWRERTR